MPEYRHVPLLKPIDSALWADTPFKRPSRGLTPLYLNRYDGPRAKKSLASHEFWELAAVFSGNGLLRWTEDLELREPMAVLIPPGLPHTELAERRIDLIWFGFQSSRLSIPDQSRPFVVESRELVRLVEELWLFAVGRQGSIGPELEGMAKTVIGRFFRLREEGEPGPAADRIREAISWIHKHFSEPVSVPVLAERMRYSEGYFRREFRSRTGRSLVHYVSMVRMEHAQRLLEHTRLPVAEVARQVGYEDPFFFSRLFRKRTGINPLAYRKRTRGVEG